jgi:hypothetical protein
MQHGTHSCSSNRSLSSRSSRSRSLLLPRLPLRNCPLMRQLQQQTVSPHRQLQHPSREPKLPSKQKRPGQHHRSLLVRQK